MVASGLMKASVPPANGDQRPRSCLPSAAHEMRTEMLQLSTKTERPDHVWKFKPLPAAGEIEGGGEGQSVGKGKKEGRAVDQDKGYWFRGGAHSASS